MRQSNEIGFSWHDPDSHKEALLFSAMSTIKRQLMNNFPFQIKNHTESLPIVACVMVHL